MNIFVYDSFLAAKNKLLFPIETKITDLGLNGKICRLESVKNINQFIQNESSQNITTLIAVGNDHTFKKLVNPAANLGVPLSIIPIGNKDNFIAEALGIPPGEKACEVISMRRLERLDLGKINDFYFLTNLFSAIKDVTIRIDGEYEIQADKGAFNIVNFDTHEHPLPENFDFDPQDGILHLIISLKEKSSLFKEKREESVFPFRYLTIEGKNGMINLNDSLKVAPPAKITVKKQGLRVIVGKDRKF